MPLPLPVSVLMPVRNARAFAAAAIDSILAQSFTDWELILANDGSTDGTGEILAAYAARDPRIRLLRNSGRGIVPALNEGLAAARGALIARMDADDIALPDRLRDQVAFMEAHGEVGVVGTAARRIDIGGRATGEITMPVADGEIRNALASRSPIIHPTAMMRRALVERLGGYRDCCTFAEDYDLWLRLSTVSRLANLPAVHLLLRSHPGQLSITRRLAQRAAAGLARRLASPDPPPVAGGGKGEDALWATLSAYAGALGARNTPFELSEWKDAEPVIRALRSQNRLSLGAASRLLARAPVGAGRKAATFSKLLLLR